MCWTWGGRSIYWSWRKISSACRLHPLCGYQDRGGRLRPGEKLYEELLTQSADLRRTEHEKIFVEERRLVAPTELDRWLESLSDAVDSGSRERIFQELHRLVPTFREPDEVNEAAIRAVEQGAAVQLEELAAVRR